MLNSRAIIISAKPSMLHLVQSNKMEVLCQHLVHQVQEYYQTSFSAVLQPLPILVQSPGMAQWLKVKVAESLGIAANFSFPLPSSFIWDLYRQHIPDLPEESAFTKENMQWKLMQILPGLLSEPEFAAITAYLTSGDDTLEAFADKPHSGEATAEKAPRRLFQLAGKIADIYDQYLVYRPDWILAWEQGEKALGADAEAHPWQPVLWRALVENTKALSQSPWHRANLHDQLMTTLAQQPPSHMPIFIFGISAIPKQQLEIFSVLAQTRDVVIFWANPCEQYWGDIIAESTKEKKQLDLFEQAQDTQVDVSLDALHALTLYETGNPLLASWGKLGREFQDMLLECENSVAMNTYDYFIEDEPNTLLRHIQQDVLMLAAPSPVLDSSLHNADGEEDRSVHVVSCHSKLRELEVLHDHVLSRLEQDRALALGDIIVMMPNVAEYAPYIDAVFGGADKSTYLGYAISDRNVIEESPVAKAFMQLLAVHQSRFTLTEVMEIFAVPDVLAKFNVDESELSLLHHWLREAGIRWGMSGEDKQRWELPQEGQNTWLFGLRRLLSGYAMGMTQALLNTEAQGEISPYAELEGQQGEVLGKFIEFLIQLEHILAQALDSHTLSEKARIAEQWLQKIFAVSDAQAYYLQQILDALARLSEHQGQYDGVVDQDVFVEAMQQQLGSKGVGQRFLAGRINFCTLMPMRSIPFKQVCILGLNDPGYPRVVAPIGFDLMASAPVRKGDRSRRWDDRYLFLEAILSAREQLYLSFIGRDERDNSVRTPSILLTELLHYCERYRAENEEENKNEAKSTSEHQGDVEEKGKPREPVVKVHAQPLQPFHADYFLANSSVASSYNQTWLNVLKASAEVTQKQSVDFVDQALALHASGNKDELPLAELLSCLRNPARYFFEQRWHTRFGSPHSLVEDDEPLLLDGLSRYQLIQSVIKDEENTQKHIRVDGRLPIGSLGGAAMEELNRITEKLVQLAASHYADLNIQAPSQWVDASHEVTKVRLMGRVDGIYPVSTLPEGNALFVRWRPGKVRAIDRILLWVEWLFVLAAEPNTNIGEACFIGTDKVMKLPRISTEAAQENLTVFMQFWHQSMLKPLVFFPESAWQWVASKDKTKTVQTYIGSDFPGAPAAEGKDPHFQRVCPQLDKQMDELILHAETLLTNLFELDLATKATKKKSTKGKGK